MKSQPLIRFVFHGAIQPNPPRAIFKLAFGGRVVRVSSCLLRAVRQIGAPRLDLASKKSFSWSSADPFSPQGVQSVGPQLFENLILQVAGRVSWAPFSCAGMAGGTEEAHHRRLRAPYLSSPESARLGSYFQTRPRASWQGARSGGWLCFFKTARDPQDWVRCAARQTAHWVHIFKVAHWHLAQGAPTGGWVCFCKLPAVVLTARTVSGEARGACCASS
jgi:hypothetical protein